MNYNSPLFRPPSEAYSFIIQATLGCPENTCQFCGMYKTKTFEIKPLDDIEKELKTFLSDSDKASIKRIFLADGDCLYAGHEYLLTLLKMINENFPNLQRITSYATANGVLKYNLKQLKELKENKLKMFYMGLESGNNELLKFVNKGNDANQFIEAGRLLKEAQIKNSVTAILGLGGKEFTKRHARDTADVINNVCPEYFSLLTLIIGGNEKYIKKIDLLSRREIFQELFSIIKELDIKTIFRSNHVSNIVPVNGTLPKDKDKMLHTLELVLLDDDPWLDRVPQHEGEMHY